MMRIAIAILLSVLTVVFGQYQSYSTKTITGGVQNYQKTALFNNVGHAPEYQFSRKSASAPVAHGVLPPAPVVGARILSRHLENGPFVNGPVVNGPVVNGPLVNGPVVLPPSQPLVHRIDAIPIVNRVINSPVPVPVQVPVPVPAPVPVPIPVVTNGHFDESHGPTEPYNFGYETIDEFGTRQNRHEESDGHGTVRGSYGFIDPHGLYRHVEYIADAYGFRANVRTNEPGIENASPAHAQFLVGKGPAHVVSAPVPVHGSVVPVPVAAHGPVIVQTPINSHGPVNGHGHGLVNGHGHGLVNGLVNGHGHGVVNGHGHGLVNGHGHSLVYGHGHNGHINGFVKSSH